MHKNTINITIIVSSGNCVRSIFFPFYLVLSMGALYNINWRVESVFYEDI